MGTTLKEACYQGTPGSAVCVQRFDDSLNSAIRITYRILLRSSSSLEPRHPLLRIVLDLVFRNRLKRPNVLSFGIFVKGV